MSEPQASADEQQQQNADNHNNGINDEEERNRAQRATTPARQRPMFGSVRHVRNYINRITNGYGNGNGSRHVHTNNDNENEIRNNNNDGGDNNQNASNARFGEPQVAVVVADEEPSGNDNGGGAVGDGLAGVLDSLDDVIILHQERHSNNDTLMPYSGRNHNPYNNLFNGSGDSFARHFNSGISLTAHNGSVGSQRRRFPGTASAAASSVGTTPAPGSVSAINGSDLVVCNHDTRSNSTTRVFHFERVEEADDNALHTAPPHHIGADSRAADGSGLVARGYMQHYPRGRRRQRREKHQIRRSLKSMNKFLRKTVYTLRRIKSLILQQVQIARNLQAAGPLAR